jgi:hypothetical protein
LGEKKEEERLNDKKSRTCLESLFVLCPKTDDAGVFSAETTGKSILPETDFSSGLSCFFPPLCLWRKVSDGDAAERERRGEEGREKSEVGRKIGVAAYHVR